MKTQGAGTKRWRKAEKRNRHTAALFTRLYLKGKAGTISIHLKTMLPLLSITTLLLFQPCFALEVGFVREFRTWMTRPAGSKCWSRIRSGASGNRDWRWFRTTSEPKRLQFNDCSCVLKLVRFFPGSSLSSEDFANGAKYNKDYESQDNSSKRAHFEEAMRFHQVLAGCPSPNTNSCPKL